MERSVNDSTMRIGLFHPTAPSVHVASRIVNDLNPNVLDLDAHIRLAQTCEALGFDFLFMADNWASPSADATRVGQMDPNLMGPILAAALFAVARQIGIVTTVHTSWFHPVVVARMGANLDTLSKGRWGINVVTGAGMAEELLRSATERTDHDERYAMAEEALAIAKQMWRGEECRFEGQHYTVHGRLVGPTTVQRPHPVIFSAGASPGGRRFAARNADWMFIPGRMSQADAIERIRLIREQSTLANRPAHSVKFMRHVSMLVRETADEARRVSDWITSAIDLPAAHAYVKSISQNISTYGDIYKQYATDDDVVRVIGVSSGAIRIHGAPRQVAEQIKELYDTQECRGIALTFPLWHVEEITRFGRLVLPILEEMGLWISPHRRGWSW
ncbi:MAG: LLM class flavin-dependent oxidoreductase [Candidatus Binatia bacterium]